MSSRVRVVFDRTSMTLALDSSIRHGGLALLASRSGEVLDCRSDLSGVGDLVRALRDLGGERGQAVTQVVATQGPGSYIGVRSGLAAALGFAQARGLPLRLLGSLTVVAGRAAPTRGALLVVASAGRGGRYAQTFEWNSCELPDEVVPLTEAVLLSAAQLPPSTWPRADRCLDPDGVGGDLLLQRVEPVRSRLDALAMVAVLGRSVESGYDLLTANYGVRVGDET
ncbi:MAG: hypothetical protein ACYDC5_02470 [Candidatus Dormibacteria bacterium]